MVEHCDCATASVHARDLDRVLDGLGPGVEQDRLLDVVTGGQLGELLTDLYIAFVRRNHEAGVGECLHLVGDPPHDGGGGVANVDDSDARC
jgi:hypothetical protein